jgi:hypothetical protein
MNFSLKFYTSVIEIICVIFFNNDVLAHMHNFFCTGYILSVKTSHSVRPFSSPILVLQKLY